MGIKYLNRFLRDNCTKKSIRKTHLKQFANKTIVIDTSIYLYKFMSDNALLENMYLLISIFKTYNITPLFIFDGKPPPEKMELLHRRKMEKKEAEQKYLNMQNLLTNVKEDEKKEILYEMDQLKRQFIRIKESDVRGVKDLMDAYGVNYCESHSEADTVCARLVNNGTAYACMSDDMDMFLYGCPIVLRHLSLMNHTVVAYETKKILTDLDMTERHFKEIMVLSGTDYNLHSNTSLTETINWFYEYKKYYCTQLNNKLKPHEFYVWLVKNTKYVVDFTKLLRTYQLFQIENNNDLKQWDNLVIESKAQNMEKLQLIMKKEGFLFC
jgi:XPG I-region/XPG N-terminal domain